MAQRWPIRSERRLADQVGAVSHTSFCLLLQSASSRSVIDGAADTHVRHGGLQVEDRAEEEFKAVGLCHTVTSVFHNSIGPGEAWGFRVAPINIKVCNPMPIGFHFCDLKVQGDLSKAVWQSPVN